jgi:predicted transcriptional regulator
MATELVKGGVADPELLLMTATSKSLTEMKTTLSDNIARKKEENNQVKQLSEQNAQLQKQLKEMQQELKKYQNAVDKQHDDKLQMEKYKVDKDYEIEMKKLKTDSDYKDSSIDLQGKRVELEALQLLDFNTKNNEVKDV